MQDNLFPILISITMLDGVKDDLDFRIQLGGDVNHDLLYPSTALSPASPLLEYQYLWVIGGISLAVLGVLLENKRRRNAKQILSQIVSGNMWND